MPTLIYGNMLQLKLFFTGLGILLDIRQVFLNVEQFKGKNENKNRI
jgi:hypothetical protein